MTSRKRKCTGFFILLLFSFSFFLFLVFFTGCVGPPVQLGFPLQDGSVWRYRGTMSVLTGKQEETMPPLVFELHSRQLVRRPDSPFEFQLTQQGEMVWSSQLVKSSKGLVNPLTGELWIPKMKKIRQKWRIATEQGRAQMEVLRESSVTVPAGTFSAYFIHFRIPRKYTGFLWLNPDVGVIQMDWKSRTPRGRFHTSLELTSYQFPES